MGNLGGNRDNADEEYNGTEWEPEWDGSKYDTSKDNTWDPSATLGDRRPEDETKAERRERLRKERRHKWAEALSEAEIEKAQRDLKREELARQGAAKRKARADKARAEAERRGYKIEDWEVDLESRDSPAAKKERKVAFALVGVGVAAAVLGGIVGNAVHPDERVRTETERVYVDNTPSLETIATNRANEIIAERGLSIEDSDRLKSCVKAVENGVEVRNYMLAQRAPQGEIAGMIDDLYAVALGNEDDLEVLNRVRIRLNEIANETYGATDRSQRVTRDFNYHAQACGVETTSEFSDPQVEPEVDHLRNEQPARTVSSGGN